MNAAKPSEKPDRSLMNDQPAKREADRAQAHRDELTNSGLHRRFDPTLVGSVMVEAGDPSPQRGANVKAIDVSLLDVPLLDVTIPVHS
ncbi:hypothetical protein QUB70_12195 [Microcoleus sp. A003_D6]|uniref:hypothetical protein n=1 Tax=Microcoleus sp. A003_D6 TaxID=3055266 RepID=UPI002FD4390D